MMRSQHPPHTNNI